MAHKWETSQLHGFFVDGRSNQRIYFTCFEVFYGSFKRFLRAFAPNFVGLPQRDIYVVGPAVYNINALRLCFCGIFNGIELDILFCDDIFMVGDYLGAAVHNSFKFLSNVFKAYRFENYFQADAIDVSAGYSDGYIAQEYCFFKKLYKSRTPTPVPSFVR